jgi:hypothetical protein
VWLCARLSSGSSCITGSIAAIRCRGYRHFGMRGATRALDRLRVGKAALTAEGMKQIRAQRSAASLAVQPNAEGLKRVGVACKSAG